MPLQIVTKIKSLLFSQGGEGGRQSPTTVLEGTRVAMSDLQHRQELQGEAHLLTQEQQQQQQQQRPNQQQQQQLQQQQQQQHQQQQQPQEQQHQHNQQQQQPTQQPQPEPGHTSQRGEVVASTPCSDLNTQPPNPEPDSRPSTHPDCEARPDTATAAEGSAVCSDPDPGTPDRNRHTWNSDLAIPPPSPPPPTTTTPSPSSPSPPPTTTTTPSPSSPSPLTQPPEETDDPPLALLQSSLTSDYETMTSTSSPTSEMTQDDAAELGDMTSSGSETNATGGGEERHNRSSAGMESSELVGCLHDGCACACSCAESESETVPFFRNHPGFPTVIEVRRAVSGPVPEASGVGGVPTLEHGGPDDNDNDEEEEEEAAAVAPSQARLVPAPDCPHHQLVPGEAGRGMGAEGGQQQQQQEQEQEGALGVEEEFFPPTVLNTPIGALRKSKRRLCLMLNVEMMHDEETGLCRDYRGLGDLIGFESLEIVNFWERNPCDTLFLEWARSRQDPRLRPPVLSSLVSCLRLLNREDVLEDCRGLILEDVSDYLAERQLLARYSAHRLERYDCYLNIADPDILTVGREIVDTLEGVYGLRLCLTLRDIPVGDWEFETMAETLETRCNSKVLLVLTRNYEASDACQFLTQFAATLDPCSRHHKLIPLVVDEDTFIPRVLRSLARLNFKRDKELGFLWPRLKHSITR